MRVRYGKKTTAKNLLVNGSFSSSSNWVAYRATRVCANGMATVTKAETEYASCYQDMSNLIVGHKYFYMIEMRNVSGITTLRYFFQNSGTGYFSKVVDSPVAGVWYDFVGGGTASGTSSRVDPQGLGPIGAVYQMRTPLVIDLTETFGSGNEPSPEQFYEMCKNCTSSLASGRDVTINERAGKVALGPVEAESDLPADYKEVEYIESSGTQYIDTGFKPTKDTDVSLETLYTVANTAYQGVYQYMGVSMRGGTSVTDYVYSNAYYSHTFTNAINTRYSIEFRHSDHGLYIDGTQIFTQSTISNIAPANFYLFAVSNSDSSTPTTAGRFASCRLYSCRITDDGTLVRDFVPCIRRSDAKPGLYDKVEGRFYVNQGAGDDFAYALFPYEFVDYLESTGTQYIDTGYIPNSKTKIIFDTKMWYSGTGGVGAYPRQGRHGEGERLSIYVTNSITEFAIGDYQQLNLNTYNVRHTFELDVPNLQGKLDGVVKCTFSEPTWTNQQSLYLFARHVNTSPYFDGNGNVINYRVSIYEDDTLVMDFIPAIRKSDFKPGMYDKVNRRFYVNSGTGEFIAPKYVPVGYIETSGTQYIDTGVSLSDDIRSVVKVVSTSTSQDIPVFGGSLSGDHGSLFGYYHLTPYSNKWYYGTNGTEKNDGSYSPTVGLSYEIDYNNNGSVYINGSLLASAQTMRGYSTSTLTIARRGSDNGSRYGKWRYEYFRVYRNSSLIHDYMPSIRKPDNKPGLYDRITKTFLTNKGSGEFSYGYRNPFDAYQRVQYIESTGTQYVNTGYAIKATDVVNIELMPLQTNVDLAFFGNYDSGTTGYAVCELGQISNSFRFNVYSNNVPLTVDSKYSFTRKDDGAWYYNGTRQNGAQTEDCYMNALIFGRWWNGGPTKLNKMRLYGLSISSASTEIRDFIPCYRKSDGEVGLWDAVTSTFYGNSGTGVFLRGPEVNVAKTAPIEPTYGYGQLIPTLSSNYWYGERNAGTANARTFDPSTNSSTYTADSVNKGFRLLSNTDAFTISVVAGHKYLYSAKHSWQLDNAVITKMSYLNVGNTNLLYGMPITNGAYTRAILSCTVSATDTYFATSPIIDSGTVEPGDTFTTKDFMLIDLTEWFGIGKEPTSVGEFTAKFPRTYYGFWKEPIRLTRRQINSLPTYGYNQVANPTPSNMNGSGTAWTTDGRDFRFQATNDGGSRCSVKNLKIVANHKYLLSCWLTQSKSGTCLLTMYNGNWTAQCMATTPTLNAGVRTHVAYIGMATFDESNGQYSFYMRYPTTTSTGDSLLVENLNVIDLTDMFGEGNEPATFDEFRELFPHAYYPYCAGSKLNRAQINAMAKD